MDQFRKSPRAPFLNYDGGDFFVTICTKNRQHFFGEISNETMHLSEIGKFLETQLNNIETLSPSIKIPLFTIMPNHVHLIVSIVDDIEIPNNCNNGFDQRHPNPSMRSNPEDTRIVPLLSRYINSLKGVVTKYAKTINPEFAWHGRYHDHAIRSNRDGNIIADYIINNVAKWDLDSLNKQD